MLEKLKSRRLWLGIITSIFLVVNAELKLVDEQTALSITGLIATLIGGISVSDYAKYRDIPISK